MPTEASWASREEMLELTLFLSLWKLLSVAWVLTHLRIPLAAGLLGLWSKRASWSLFGTAEQ